MVESATDAAPLRLGDLTSIAPLLILSASCECEGDAPLRATPPSISVSDILRGGVFFGELFLPCMSRQISFLPKKLGGPCPRADLRGFWWHRKLHRPALHPRRHCSGCLHSLPCRRQYASGASPSFPLMPSHNHHPHRGYCTLEQHSFPRPQRVMRQHRRGKAW